MTLPCHLCSTCISICGALFLHQWFVFSPVCKSYLWHSDTQWSEDRGYTDMPWRNLSGMWDWKHAELWFWFSLPFSFLLLVCRECGRHRLLTELQTRTRAERGGVSRQGTSRQEEEGWREKTNGDIFLNLVAWGHGDDTAILLQLQRVCELIVTAAIKLSTAYTVKASVHLNALFISVTLIGMMTPDATSQNGILSS